MPRLRFMVTIDVEQEFRPPVEMVIQCIRKAVGEDLGLSVSVSYVNSTPDPDEPTSRTEH
jgi:hypothetical protein